MTFLTLFVNMEFSSQMACHVASLLAMTGISLAMTGNVCYNISQEEIMTNEKAIKALRQIKTYCAATQLEELDYAIEVLEKLEKDGVKEPLATDFKNVENKK